MRELNYVRVLKKPFHETLSGSPSKVGEIAHATTSKQTHRWFLPTEGSFSIGAHEKYVVRKGLKFEPYFGCKSML